MAPEATVLVVTASLDPHADAVQDALDELGVGYFRLHPRELLCDYAVEAAVGCPEPWSVVLQHRDGRSLQMPQEGLVGYFRKPQPVEPGALTAEGEAAQFAAAEGGALVRSILRMPGVPWFPSPDRVRRASAKLPQLAAALASGLSVPKTLVTSSAEKAAAFADAQGGSVICKRVGAQPVLTSEKLVLYTSRVTASELLGSPEAVGQAPLLLQEEIAKDHELRVVVIGDEVIACRIDSQEIEESRVDWRVVDPFDLKHEIVELPAEVTSALRSFMSAQSLDFAVIDMAVTPEGHHVFFENNPNGQWYWIELLTGFPIARRVATHLVQLAAGVV